MNVQVNRRDWNEALTELWMRVQCKIRSGKNWKKERKERNIQWNENKTARENPADKKKKE